MVSVLSLNCPVCGAPFSPGADRCGYCGSILVLQTDHPRIDPRALNRAVVNEKISSYRDLLRQDPHSVKAHYGLGVAYFNLGLTEAAIDSLEKACSITPENPHIHTQLAVAWREEAKTGDTRAVEEMRDHIQYALRLDPGNIEALILASEMAAADHDVQMAADFSERAWKVAPERARDLHKRNLGAWFRWKTNRRDVTAADSERVREFSPDLAASLQSIGGGSTAFALGTPTVPSMNIDLAKPVSRIRSVITAFLTGAGLMLVSCVFLAIMTDNVESGSAASAWLGFLYLALLFLPFILAIRAWYTHR